ncbi:MAG TPA: LuxR C-terminal-related transcriptional regulator [Candidatus Limnocylindrales bacterium]|jgi:LuxR family maltose regulon positive regulatory protein
MPVALPIGARRRSPDGLLATKLHLPRLRPGHVRRPRLIDALDAASDRSLIVVCAPAGFGKTALLAEWAGRHRDTAAWLSVDPEDNDPVRFWRHVAATIDRVRPGTARELEPPPAAESASLEPVVARLINALATDTRKVTLVLDDFDAIEDDAVRGSLVFLLDHRPPGLAVVLACRADPRIPLARLRAGGQLAELRAADLRFTARETAELLRLSPDPQAALPEEVVAALVRRTEGWAAGLQLAALSLQDAADPAAFVAAFSGSHRHILDYLTEEVLERQPRDVREFLLATSPLDRLSGDLCDAVIGGSGGQEMLERIERANLFLIPLDEVRGWWRYNRLFRDLLRVRLDGGGRDGVLAIHRSAAAWLDAHGFGDEAVRHAMAAGDATWAARLIERHGSFQPPLGEDAPASVEPLSERELEVLDLLAAGRSNQEIADELFVTVDTVKKHNTHILGKLGASNRTQAAARARELGLLV